MLAEAERKAGNRRRTKRKVITGAVYRWPKNRPIPFVFGHYDSEFEISEIFLTKPFFRRMEKTHQRRFNKMGKRNMFEISRKWKWKR